MAEAPKRKLWLDWQRGLAVLYMVEWHSWDSWRADAIAHGQVQDLMATIGGFAAPSVLYMAGLSLFLGDAAQERKGVPVRERRIGAVRRALWLLGVAYLFRAFEYLAGGGYYTPNGWEAILKVDVLNVIAVSLLFGALLTIGVEPRRRVLVAAAAAAAVAFLAPVVAGWQHPPSRILDYFYSEWPRGIFYLFPWAAFCFAGTAFGRLASSDAKPWAWLAAGALLVLAGRSGEMLPAFYSHQDFWRTSPQWLAMRLGIVVAMSGLLQLIPASADRYLAWLRTMGRHSLLGYFVSVELPYGALSSMWHKKLGTGAAIAGVFGMIAVTWVASEISERYDLWKAARARRGSAATPAAAA